jgi:hypothetical protein
VADMLATTEDLTSLLQRDPINPASATLAIEIATAVVQAAAGQRILLVGPDTETVWGGPDQVLRLREGPIVSVTSVTYNGTLLTEGTASGTWRRSMSGLWRDIGWVESPGEPSEITVVYTHGYAADDQRIQLARSWTLSIARGLFTNPDGAVREQIDDYAIAYSEAAATLDAIPGAARLLRKQYGPKARMIRVI